MTGADSVLGVPGGNGASGLGSDSVLSERKTDGTSAWNMPRWFPGECNATLTARHNWFWQPGETWRPASELLEMYYASPRTRGRRRMVRLWPRYPRSYPRISCADSIAGWPGRCRPKG
ncbi:hypothetical protein AB0O34_35885 [Sphaerisporangium sp. NPDC088356]|uniref:hypothetical protein n=1 Tax=Sphaerisporangium sp. NPDC088356 TaxID=3154871 RepID=UPI0034369E8D